MPASRSPVSERMADAIVLAVRERGYCCVGDLEADGFKAEDIGRFWAYANALAAVQLMPKQLNNKGGIFYEWRVYS
jgi:hypothetical protein